MCARGDSWGSLEHMGPGWPLLILGRPVKPQREYAEQNTDVPGKGASRGHGFKLFQRSTIKPSTCQWARVWGRRGALVCSVSGYGFVQGLGPHPGRG